MNEQGQISQNVNKYVRYMPFLISENVQETSQFQSVMKFGGIYYFSDFKCLHNKLGASRASFSPCINDGDR